MTAPDVRTAAQAEAERQFIPRDRPTMVTETVAVQSFIDGAVWGTALVTPTREQIARALCVMKFPKEPCWRELVCEESIGSHALEIADVVMALLSRGCR